MINASFGSEGNPNLENDFKNDKWLFSEKLTKWTCKMITQENDESVLKNQQSAQLWLIIFLGNDCILTKKVPGLVSVQTDAENPPLRSQTTS